MKPLVTCGFPSQGITGVELWWFSVRRFHRRWIPLKKVGLMFSFMFAWTSYLTNNTLVSEFKSHDAYAISLLCVICQSDIPHGWTSGWLRHNYIENLTGCIWYKTHPFDLCDKQITCDHGCVKYILSMHVCSNHWQAIIPCASDIEYIRQ